MLRDTEELKFRAAASAETVLAKLGITARPNRAGLISCCDPVTGERNPSLAIWIKGGTITFKRYGSPHQGDVFNLVAYLNNWTHLPRGGFLEAARWLEDLLGLRHLSADERREDLAKARARAARQREDQAAAAEKAARRAKGLWLSALPIPGTPVETYLRTRGIDLAALPRLPRILRCLPNAKHRGDDGRETWWPAMIAGCTDGTGEIRAVHRTWLRPDGAGKAPVAPVKKVWPGFAGLVIPVWKGDGDLSVRDACATGLLQILVITEGIEDALTAALAAPEHRVWAAISLSNIRNIRLPDCIEAVAIHRQNDWDKRSAVEEFEAGVAALEAQGRPVVPFAASTGKDINDTLRGAS
ncbi:MAG: toprim domain-containing protein [Rhodovulum sp.]|nr:toprim domain-containing protein [Rhodovulum sp.]